MLASRTGIFIFFPLRFPLPFCCYMSQAMIYTFLLLPRVKTGSPFNLSYHVVDELSRCKFAFPPLLLPTLFSTFYDSEDASAVECNESLCGSVFKLIGCASALFCLLLAFRPSPPFCTPLRAISRYPWHSHSPSFLVSLRTKCGAHDSPIPSFRPSFELGILLQTMRSPCSTLSSSYPTLAVFASVIHFIPSGGLVSHRWSICIRIRMWRGSVPGKTSVTLQTVNFNMPYYLQIGLVFVEDSFPVCARRFLLKIPGR